MAGIFLVLFLLHCTIVPDFGDDLANIGALKERALIPILWNRYRTWSSRTLIDAVMLLVEAGGVWVWRVLNSLIAALLVWNVSDLFGRGRGKFVFLLLLAFLPQNCLKEAGWMTTTINYLWPACLGLIAMRPLKRLLLGEKCAMWECVVCLPCLLFSANMEQMGAILLAAWLIVGGWSSSCKRGEENGADCRFSIGGCWC